MGTKNEAKSEEVENLLELFSKTFLAQSRSEAFPSQTCVMCKGPATEFTDALSKKEYTLSGMCQKCQDNFFE